MRLPLGSIDTRVTMTDSLADGLLSPSFASVLAFDDLAYYDQVLDEMGSQTHDTKPAQQGMSNTARERPYLRLELDANMDKYHSLDGFAEPLDPQNTPASNSDHESPDESTRRRKTENLRTTSAPHLNLRWFERQPDGSLSFLPGEGDDGARTQKRRFSADDEPQPTTLPKTIDQPTGVGLFKRPDDVPSSLRCVRFTPPCELKQQRSPRLVQRPLPSVERKQDYIACYRQQKQHEKWQGPNRALSHRLSPYRNPPKVPRCVRPSKLKRNTPYSTSSKLPPRPDESYTNSVQDTPDDSALGSRDPGSKNAGDAPDGALPRRAYDLVAITIGVYQFRYPGSDLRGGVFHIRVDSTVIPTSHLLQETGEEKHAVVRTGVEDLLLHTCVIMPAFMMRIPLAMLSAADRFVNSRVGLVALNALRMAWAVSIRFLVTIISRLLGRDTAYYAGMRHGNHHERQRRR